jgi:hypothetical protein
LIVKPEKKRPLEDLNEDRRIILKRDIKDIRRKGLDWIHLAQNRVRRWVLVSTVP